jgi:hypothetical protein
MPKTKLTDLAKKAKEIKNVEPKSEPIVEKKSPKEVVEELLGGIDLNPKNKTVVKTENKTVVDKGSVDWLSDQIGLLTEENERLRNNDTDLRIEEQNKKITHIYMNLLRAFQNSSSVDANGKYLKVGELIFNEFEGFFPHLKKYRK